MLVSRWYAKNGVIVLIVIITLEQWTDLVV